MTAFFFVEKKKIFLKADTRKISVVHYFFDKYSQSSFWIYISPSKNASVKLKKTSTGVPVPLKSNNHYTFHSMPGTAKYAIQCHEIEWHAVVWHWMAASRPALNGIKNPGNFFWIEREKIFEIWKVFTAPAQAIKFRY